MTSAKREGRGHLMAEEKVTLFAFRYAISRRDTSLEEITHELEDRLPTLPRWVVAQMLRDCEHKLSAPKACIAARPPGLRNFAGLCEVELLRRGPEVAQ